MACTSSDGSASSPRSTDAALDVANGHSRLVVVRGAAGMGKTTLCEHAAPLLAQQGFTVTWGRGWPDGGAPPLWPWTSVLRDLGGDDAAAILDEDGRAGTIDADRFARFAAVADVLRGRASNQPAGDRARRRPPRRRRRERC